FVAASLLVIGITRLCDIFDGMRLANRTKKRGVHIWRNRSQARGMEDLILSIRTGDGSLIIADFLGQYKFSVS
ncbi:hypothetical protein IFM89_029523, partial [Coptis chinensis]